MTILREYPQTSFKFFLVSHQDLVHYFACHQSSDVWVNASRFPEACSCSDSRWCLCVQFWIWVQVHREVLFPNVWERLYTPRRIPWECTPHRRILWNVMLTSAMSCLKFVSCNSQLLASWLFFAAFSLRMLSLCDSLSACIVCPCNSSFDKFATLW